MPGFRLFDAEAKVSLDDADARRALKRFQKDFHETMAKVGREDATATLEADLTDVEKKVKRAEKMLRGWERRRAVADVEADVMGAERKIARLQKELNYLEREKYVVEVTLNNDARQIPNMLGRIGRSLLGLNKQANQTRNIFQRMGDALHNARIEVGPLSLSLRGLLVSLATLAPMVTSVGGALGALAASMVSAVAGAGGLAAALGVGLAGSIASIVSIVKPLAGDLGDLQDAQDAYNKSVRDYGRGSDEAAKKLNILRSVQKSVGAEVGAQHTTLKQITKRWAELTKAARPEYFELIGHALDRINKRMPQFARSATFAFTQAAKGARTMIDVLSGREASGNATIILDRMSRTTPAVAKGFSNLGLVALRVFRSFSRFFGPVTRGFRDWTQSLLGATNNARDLNKWVDRLMGSSSAWGGVMHQLSRLVLGFFRAALPQGDRMARNLERTVKSWADWMNSREGQRETRQFLRDAADMTRDMLRLLGDATSVWFQLAEAARPMVGIMIDIVGWLAKLTRGFVDATGGSDGLVRGLAGLFILSKAAGWAGELARFLGGAKVLSALKLLAAGKGFRAVLDVFGKRGTTPANPLFVKDISLGGGRGPAKGPGGVITGGGPGGKGGRLIGKLFKGVPVLGSVIVGVEVARELGLGLPNKDRETRGRGAMETRGQTPSGQGGRMFNPQDQNVNVSINNGRKPSEGQIAAAIGKGHIVKATRDIEKNFAQMKNRTGADVRGMLTRVNENFDRIRGSVGTKSRQAREMLGDNFRAGARSILRAMRDGDVGTGRGMRSIRDLIKTHSRGGRVALEGNMDGVIQSIRRAMKKGGDTTGQGMRVIRMLMAQELKNLGLSDEAVKFRLEGKEQSGKTIEAPLVNKRRGGLVFAQGGMVPAMLSPGEMGITPTGEQFHVPGLPTAQDNVPMMLSPGTAILTHSGQDLHAAGMPLPEVMKRQSPHFRRGGQVQKFKRGGIVGIPWAPGEEVAAGVLPLLTKLHRAFGFGVSDAFDRDRSAGHESPGHNVTGTAVDVIPGSTGWPGVNRLVKWAVNRGLKTLYDGQFGSTPYPNHGEGNHAHIEFPVAGGAKLGGGTLTGMATPEFTPLRRLKLTGGSGALKSVVQGTLDNTRKAANKRLRKLASTVAAPGAGGVSMRGVSGSNQQMARQLMERFGFSANQWPALKELWTRESGWNEGARNPSSGAYGIPQSLPASKMGAAAQGTGPKAARAQIHWGLKYIKGRYGSPAAALSFHNANNWYRGGGYVQNFRDGGAVLAARAAAAAGFKGANLVRMVAEAGGESRYDPRAVGDGGASKGLWQIHTGWNPWAKRMNLFDRNQNAKAAMRIFKAQGVGAWHANHTPFMNIARRAVAKIGGANRGRRGDSDGGDPSKTNVKAPAITNPLLPSLMQPLVEDALMGGIQARMDRTPRWQILQQVLEGIVPQPEDRATITEGGAAAGGRGTIRHLAYAGDSLGVGTRQFGGFASKLGKIKLSMDVAKNRRSSAAAARLQKMIEKRTGAAVLDAGSNDGKAGTTRAAIRRAKAKLGKRPLIMPTVVKGVRDHAHINAAIRGAANKVVPWGQVAEPFLSSDRIHPTKAGYIKRAQMIANTVRSIPGPLGARKAAGRDGTGAKGGSRVQASIAAMQQYGNRVARKHTPYVYGGGHGGWGSGPPFDCSGFVSHILHAGGLMRGAPMTTDGLKSWGLPGGGRNVTVGVRGSTGANAHTMMKVGNQYFESGGGGGAGRRSGWSGSFPIKRHPKFRTGGIIQNFRGGGVALGGPNVKEVIGRPGTGGGRNFRRTAFRAVRQLGMENIGSTLADELTRTLYAAVDDVTFRSLVVMDRRIKRQIRAMAKGGLTGGERIRTRRLQGAMALVQDQMGRRLGGPLAASDRLQERLARQEAQLPLRQTIRGVAPDSLQGMNEQIRQQAAGSMQTSAMIVKLQRQLTRAQRTRNRRAADAIRAEIRELQDQRLQYNANVAQLIADRNVAQRYGYLDTLSARARLTAGTGDDIAAAREWQKQRQGELALTQWLKPGDWVAQASALNNLADANEALKALEEAAASAAKELTEADVAQAKLNAERAQNSARFTRNAFSTFFGAGDIGRGGVNAWAAATQRPGPNAAMGGGLVMDANGNITGMAGGGPTAGPGGIKPTATVQVNINTLHPGDPAVYDALARAAATGLAQQGAVLSSHEVIGG